MKTISEQLMNMIKETVEKLNILSSSDWNYRRAPGKWTRKEILGHLIDSAANNHQRFVRLQFENNPTIRYNQNEWVAAEDFINAEVDNLIILWASYNKHLAHIISKIPEEKYNNLCDLGKEEPVTLKWIASDYLRHMKHHLDQMTI